MTSLSLLAGRTVAVYKHQQYFQATCLHSTQNFMFLGSYLQPWLFASSLIMTKIYLRLFENCLIIKLSQNCRRTNIGSNLPCTVHQMGHVLRKSVIRDNFPARSYTNQPVQVPRNSCSQKIESSLISSLDMIPSKEQMKSMVIRLLGFADW